MAKMDQNSDFDQGFWKNGINFTRFKRRGIKKSKFGEKNEFLSILAEGGGVLWQKWIKTVILIRAFGKMASILPGLKEEA